MPVLSRLRSLWKNLTQRGRIERDLDDEIRATFEILVAEKIQAGLPPDAARRAATLEFGGIEQVKEEVRYVSAGVLLNSIRQDVGYAARSLRKNPGFAAVAVLTLALGIGSTTAIFSVVRGVLLAPSPFKDADRIVQIFENVPAEESFSGRAMRIPSMNQEEFDWWRKETKTLSHMAATMPDARTITTAEGTERVEGARVSPALFPMRGVQPILGRWLLPDEERPGASVAVLSEASWRRYYGSDPGIINRSLVLDGQVYTIVGVMPDAFGRQAFWLPFVVEPPRAGTVMFISVTSRLEDGIALEDAVAEANSLGQRLRGVPAEAGRPLRFEVVRERDQLVASVRPALRVLVAAVAVVLLIVCANLANLLLARGTRRHQEMGIRRALGATRLRIVRQLLTESVVLSLAGSVAGAVLAFAGVSFVRVWAVVDIPSPFRFALGLRGPTILPRVNEIAVDPAALAFAFGLSLVTGVLFGLAPALRLSRADHRGMTGGTLAGHAGISSAHTRAGQLLAGIQLALATALLVGAGLLVHSFVNLSSLPLGFDLGTQVFQLVGPGDYRPSRKIALASEVQDRLSALPGVEAVGFTNMGQPLEPDDDQGTFVPVGWQVDRANPGEENRSEARDSTPDYLRALGVRLIEGRWFDSRDKPGGPPVMLVNRAWVKRFSPHRSPIGTTAVSLCRVLVPGRGCTDTPYEIVGVVDDIRLRMEGGGGGMPGSLPDSERPRAVFKELRQSLPPPEVMDRPGRMDMGSGSAGGADGLAFAVRVKTAPLALADLRRVVREVDSRLAVEDLATLGKVLSAILARPRFYATVLTLFGGLAAVIAAIGVYGVLAYATSQRTQEFGIRLALGATPRQVLRLALRQGVLVVAVGIPAGVLAAVGLTRYLAGMLFGLTPLDAPTYAAVAIAFTAVALLASYMPARRATRVDPAMALRCE